MNDKVKSEETEALSPQEIIDAQEVKINSLEEQIKSLVESIRLMDNNINLLSQENLKRSRENAALNKHGVGAFPMSSEGETEEKIDQKMNIKEDPDLKEGPENFEKNLHKVKKENYDKFFEKENKYAPSAPYMSRSNSSSPDREQNKKFNIPQKTSSFKEQAEDQDNVRAPAKEIIRTVDIFRGKDDIGLEDFIQNVKEARAMCTQPQLLLKFILTEKLMDNAKRAIRFTRIEKYSELFTELRRNLGNLQSSSVLRTKLNDCTQMTSESVRDFNSRFKQRLNELQYVISSENSNPLHRKIALQIEEKTTLKTYVSKLKFDIAHQVRARGPESLHEAMQEAVEAECWLKQTQKVSRPVNSSVRPPNGNPRTSNHNNYNSTSNNFKSYESKPFNKPFNPNNSSKPFNNSYKPTDGQNSKFDPSRRPQNSNFRTDYHQPRPPHRTNLVVEEEEEAEKDETTQEEETMDHMTECPQYQEDYYPSSLPQEGQEDSDDY